MSLKYRQYFFEDLHENLHDQSVAKHLRVSEIYIWVAVEHRFHPRCDVITARCIWSRNKSGDLLAEAELVLLPRNESES